MEDKTKIFFEKYEPAILNAGFSKATYTCGSNSQLQEYVKDGVLISFMFRNERGIPFDIYANPASNSWGGIDTSTVFIEMINLLNLKLYDVSAINLAIADGINYYDVYDNEPITEIVSINQIAHYFTNCHFKFCYFFPKSDFKKLVKNAITYFTQVTLFLQPDGQINYHVKLSYVNFLNFVIELNHKNEFLIKYEDNNNEIRISSESDLHVLTEYIRESIAKIINPLLKSSIDFDIMNASKSDIDKALELYLMQTI